MIPLTKGQVALVDDDDFVKLSGIKWYAHWSPSAKTFYAIGPGKISLHRRIMGITNPIIRVDHKNHNGLDCQRKNLRSCSHAQNIANRRGANSNSSSRIRGVWMDLSRKKWFVQIQVKGKKISLGRFNKKRDAAEAYAVANRLYFGEFGGGL